MKGLFFVHIQQADNDVMNIRTGVVKQQVGNDRWLLQFKGKNYLFSNVFNSEQLERFAFFDTPIAQQAFIDELLAPQLAAAKQAAEQAAQTAEAAKPIAEPAPEPALAAANDVSIAEAN